MAGKKIIRLELMPAINLNAYTVLAVSPDSQADLRYALQGIDLVISVVSGNPLINLIYAASHSKVVSNIYDTGLTILVILYHLPSLPAGSSTSVLIE
ncbi:hypothetical protein PZA11_004088 [Diplocarpon coronariae]